MKLALRGKKPVAVYVIEVSDNYSVKEEVGHWTVKKRFSEVKAFYDQLRVLLRGTSVSLLPMPSKTYSLHSTAGGTVAYRRDRFGAFFRDLTSEAKYRAILEVPAASRLVESFFDVESSSKGGLIRAMFCDAVLTAAQRLHISKAMPSTVLQALFEVLLDANPPTPRLLETQSSMPAFSTQPSSRSGPVSAAQPQSPAGKASDSTPPVESGADVQFRRPNPVQSAWASSLSSAASLTSTSTAEARCAGRFAFDCLVIVEPAVLPLLLASAEASGLQDCVSALEYVTFLTIQHPENATAFHTLYVAPTAPIFSCAERVVTHSRSLCACNQQVHAAASGTLSEDRFACPVAATEGPGWTG